MLYKDMITNMVLKDTETSTKNSIQVLAKITDTLILIVVK